MLTVYDTAGTNPIHNKKPKKKPAGELDDEDMAFKQKQMAGTLPPPSPLPVTIFPPAAHAAAWPPRCAIRMSC